MTKSPRVDHFTQLIKEGKVKDSTDEEIARRDKEAGHIVLFPSLEIDLKGFKFPPRKNE